jgi:hypothetical protein
LTWIETLAEPYPADYSGDEPEVDEGSDGMSVSSDSFCDVAGKFRYRLNRKWDIALTYWTVKDDLDELKNEFERSGITVDIGYSF